ncbi:intraflagellar transport protein 52-like protein, partial [Dinothrombium tinctorium]
NEKETTKQSIILDALKNPQFTFNENLRTLQRRLKSNGWKVSSNKDELNNEILSQAGIYVIAGPRGKYTETEFNHLRKYVQNGGKLWVMLGEGGERKYATNINFLLEEFGIMVNSDAVIRTAYYKYFHPKEAFISNGILNRAILETAKKLSQSSSTEEGFKNRLDYVYPFGATLNVSKPAVPILSTGSISYPLNRPICALYVDKINGGKIAVVGSAHMFADSYIEKEDNSLIKDIILQFFKDQNFPLNAIDAEDPEISDYYTVPDIQLLAEQPFASLKESEEIPSDYTKLFSKKLFEIDNSILPKVIHAYEEFQMEKEQLKLIKPQFETPLPNLQPAVFPPIFRGLPKPHLELFDLDEAFSSVQTRLIQVANKCTDEDLEYYIKESGLVLGISDSRTRSAKSILEHIFKQIVEYKKVNNERE